MIKSKTKFKFSRHAFFYGRNGVGEAQGVQIEATLDKDHEWYDEDEFLLPETDIVLRPLYTEKKTTVTTIAIPKQDLPKFIEELQKLLV